MYVYLDKNGTIKEIVNDEALRQTSSNVNTIHVFFDTDESLNALLCTYELPDGTATLEAEVSTSVETGEVPYDAKRDLKYFEYFKDYPFYTFKISDEALAQNGTVKVTLRFVDSNNTYIKVVGLLTFNVEAEVTQSDYDITTSQYNYLIKKWLESDTGKVYYDHSIHFKAYESGDAGVLAEGWVMITNTSLLALNASDFYTYCETKKRIPVVGYYKNENGIFNLAYINEQGHIYVSPLVSTNDEPIDTELNIAGSSVFEDNVTKES